MLSGETNGDSKPRNSHGPIYGVNEGVLSHEFPLEMERYCGDMQQLSQASTGWGSLESFRANNEHLPLLFCEMVKC